MVSIFLLLLIWYLQDPDKFYRRFRIKVGEDENGQPIYGRKWKRRGWDATLGKDDGEKLLENETVKKLVGDAQVKKIIFVPGRLLNIVC